MFADHCTWYRTSSLTEFKNSWSTGYMAQANINSSHTSNLQNTNKTVFIVLHSHGVKGRLFTNENLATQSTNTNLGKLGYIFVLFFSEFVFSPRTSSLIGEGMKCNMSFYIWIPFNFQEWPRHWTQTTEQSWAIQKSQAISAHQ